MQKEPCSTFYGTCIFILVLLFMVHAFSFLFIFQTKLSFTLYLSCYHSVACIPQYLSDWVISNQVTNNGITEQLLAPCCQVSIKTLSLSVCVSLSVFVLLYVAYASIQACICIVDV